jgi:DNA-binding beta-propeller fold protein YncE
VEVIDLAQNQRAATVKGLRKPTGIAFIADLRRVAVASGDDGTCRFFDATSPKLLGTINGLDDADNVRYDAQAKQLYVGYGAGALSVIDAAAMKKVADVKLPAHPESFRLEEHGPRVFVNLPDAGGAIAVVDRQKRAVVATWRPKEAGANFPMWLDEPRRRLLVGCRKPAKLLVLDTDTGRTVASVACIGDADDLFLDSQMKRVYISGGEGAISIIEQLDADHYREAAGVPTAPGARTSLFVPELSRLYLAVPHRGAQPAEVRVYSAGTKNPNL